MMRQPSATTEPTSRALRVMIPAGPEAPAHARHALRALAPVQDCRLGELVVSELVTNAVRHSHTRPGETIELGAELEDGVLRVEVTDRGDGFAHDGSAPRRGTVGGWGLHMVREVSDTWWIERLADARTRVVAELPVAGELAAEPRAA